jgi:hypothetical protein
VTQATNQGRMAADVHEAWPESFSKLDTATSKAEQQ